MHLPNSSFKSIFLLLLLFSILHALFLIPSAVHAKDGQSILRYRLRSPCVSIITHTITVRNPGPSKLLDGQLVVPLIQNETARCFAIIQNFSVQPKLLRSDNYGNLYAYWEAGSLNKGQSLSMSIHYNVMSFSVDFPINLSLIKPYDASLPIYQNYTRPEELIESTHPLINSTAWNIVAKETNPHEMAFKIYNFVVDTLEYSVQQVEMGALWALQNKKGDCSEYSYLFAALCRAVGVPSRTKAGFVFHSETEALEDGHMWAEYYLEGYGWIPVDPTWRIFDGLDNRHLSSLQSMPEHMSYANYAFNFSGNAAPVDKQTVQISKASISIFDDFSTAHVLADAVSKIQNNERASTIAMLLGASILFPSDFHETVSTLNECDLQVQETMDLWPFLPDSALNSAQIALQKGEKAVNGVWTLILKTISVLIILCVMILLALIFLMKRGGQSKV